MNRSTTVSILRTVCEVTSVALVITSAYSAFYVATFAVVTLGLTA